MDAPAMFQRKQVPEDAGLRNTGADDSAAAGGQAQLHREEKEKKPVLKKVKDKVKKIKSTLKGKSNSDEHGREDRANDDDMYSGDEEEENSPLEREAAQETGGYSADVEDKKPISAEPDPEVHGGAPMYESERTPAVQDLVAKYDPAKAAARETHDTPGARSGNLGGGPAVHDTAPREVHGDDAPGARFGDLGSGAAVHNQSAPRDDSPKVRLGDLGGSAVEDPAAPRSTQPFAREGEDIGSTPVVRDFENMSISDDPSHVGAAKTGAPAEEWKDAAADKLGGGSTGESGAGTYTEKLKYAAAVPTEYGRKLASTVYEKVAGGGGTNTAEGAKTRDNENREPDVPVSEAGAEEFADAPAPADVDTTNTTTDRSSAGGPGYTEKIKSTAAGTALYGKQLASTAYEKVAAVAPSLRPQQKADETRTDEQAAVTQPASDATATTEKRDRDAMLTDMASTDNNNATTNTNAASSGPGYTDKIKSAAMGTTEYGKQLASTVYEKVAGVGSAAAGKVQSAAPGTGAQNDGNGQDKGVGVTAKIAEMLRPSDEDRALSKDISGAVQQRKENVGGTVGTVGQSVPAPGQIIAKAREAVTSLTGGIRASETAQPDAATGAEVKENVGDEAPVLRGEEVGERQLNTNAN